MARAPANPWSIDERHFPAHGSAAERWRFLLRYAILAPSSHNTQPWRFHLQGDELQLLRDSRRALPVVDPDGREQLISCGAALLNLRLAARHFGYRLELKLLPTLEADTLARIRLVAPHAPPGEDELQFQAIQRRHTFRGAFEPRPVPDALVQALRAQARREGAWLRVVHGDDARRLLAGLVEEGDRLQARNRAYRHELSRWVRPSYSRAADGMPLASFGLRGILSWAGPLLLRHTRWGRLAAARSRRALWNAPLLLVLGTHSDTPYDWLAAGQALERILLLGAAEGLSAGYLNQPVQVDLLRSQLRLALGEAGYPQLILRMGYGPLVPPTPRRHLDDVLEELPPARVTITRLEEGHPTQRP